MDRARGWLASLPVADRVVAGLAVIVLALFAFSTEDQGLTGDGRPFDAGAAGLLIAAFGLLLLRKRFPGIVVVASVAVATTWYFIGYTNSIINAPILVAFYQLGTTGDLRRQISFGLAASAIPAIGILGFADQPVSEAVDAVGYPLAALLFGEIVRSRRLLLDEYAEKAAAAEAERDSEAERAVAEERLRIARDVHDVLAHAVSVMTVQAGVAADAQGRDPAAVKAALAAIRSSGKEAMAEMRTTVAVLRGSDRADTAPAPRLDRLPELVESARAQGLEVELDVEDVNGVESLVELTIYRVVQESLTNVIRHARADHATIKVERRAGELVVEVTDNGRGWPMYRPGKPTDGLGLRGMRERVESLGGTVQFGCRAMGGWQVVASVPAQERTGTSS